MKTKLELETVEVEKIKLDIYFNYTRNYGFEIQSVEDVTGAQDLMPLLSDWVIETIEKELSELYRRREWL